MRCEVDVLNNDNVMIGDKTFKNHAELYIGGENERCTLNTNIIYVSFLPYDHEAACTIIALASMPNCLLDTLFSRKVVITQLTGLEHIFYSYADESDTIFGTSSIFPLS